MRRDMLATKICVALCSKQTCAGQTVDAVAKLAVAQADSLLQELASSETAKNGMIGRGEILRRREIGAKLRNAINGLSYPNDERDVRALSVIADELECWNPDGDCGCEGGCFT
jgi:hypothetical protein